MTAQIHERLYLNGRLTSMACEPDLPENHPRVVAATDEEIAMARGDVFSTACWREYLGTWKIKDGKFYLLRVEGKCKLVGTKPLFADWYSGILIVPHGELLEYVHAGYASVFEKETQILVENGLVVASRTIDNRTDPDARYELWVVDSEAAD